MYLKFRTGLQKKLILQALKKAGSERKLTSLVGIPNGSIFHYKNELRNLPEKYAIILSNFVGIPFSKIESEWVHEKLPNNWGKVKGGKNSIISKIANGTFEKNLDALRKSSSRRMKLWHSTMKKEYGEKYYQLQYSRFKKISSYDFKTSRGEYVRNILEKRVADHLHSLGIDYQYEAYLKTGNKVYFPDFIFGRTIVEVTEWRGYQKAYLLKEKIRNFIFIGFKVIVVVPKRLWVYYKPILPFLVDDKTFLAIERNDLYTL